MLSRFVTIHAAALAVVAACEPAPGGDIPSAVEEATESPTAGPTPTRPAANSSPLAAEPGFAGAWAFADADCTEPAKTFKLTGSSIVLTPGEHACSMKTIDEQHPTGRSAIYLVQASCLANGEVSEDTFKLEFGASDTVMQLQLNDGEPIRLLRCPAQ